MVHPIKYQLTTFLEKRNFANLLQKQKKKVRDPGTKGEVFTGDRYNCKNIQDFLNESPLNFTMTFSTHGIKPLRASSVTLWPITCSINELDTHLKSKFLTLCCLYSGTNKQPPETLLKPFLDQTISLFGNGFDWYDSTGKKNTSKVMFCLCVVDAPARAMFCNLVQYNGAFGCGHCLHEGSRARKGKGTAQVFDVIHPLPPLRDQDSMIEHAYQAIEENKPFLGVKGPTSLNLIPNFDVACGEVPDIMHGLFLGLDNQFHKLWKTTRTGSF